MDRHAGACESGAFECSRPAFREPRDRLAVVMDDPFRAIVLPPAAEMTGDFSPEPDRRRFLRSALACAAWTSIEQAVFEIDLAPLQSEQHAGPAPGSERQQDKAPQMLEPARSPE